VLIAVRRDDPVCAKLRSEFGVRFGNSWVVVLDPKGETLASWIGDAAGAGCKKRSAEAFPQKFAEAIERCLTRRESLQELERRWRREPGNLTVFETLANRFQEMQAPDRLRQLCLEGAADASLREEQRQEFTLRAYIAKTRDFDATLRTREGRNAIIKEGEKLLLKYASHPRATDLPGALFWGGYVRSFDVPEVSQRALCRLEKLAKRRSDPAPLQDRIHQLAAIRQEWIEKEQEYLQKATGAAIKRIIGAQLGDVRAAVELCSESPYKDFPEYQEWLQDAKRKLRREKALSSRVRR
jgi:hypothetical protein